MPISRDNFYGTTGIKRLKDATKNGDPEIIKILVKDVDAFEFHILYGL